MHRKHFLVLCLIGLLAWELPAPRAVAQETWEQYQSRLEQARRDAAKRHEQWVEERIKRNSEWRQFPGTDEDRLLELPDAGLEPGRYTIRLPFGLGGVRVMVPEDRRAPGALPAWSDRSYGDVYSYVRRMNHQVSDLQLELRRLGQTELAAEAGRIHDQGSQIASAIVARQPGAEIKKQFADFDKLWHPFAHRLRLQEELGRTVQNGVAATQQLDDGLHQLLAILPAPAYDRPLVAALTSELVQSTSHLLEDLKLDPRQSSDMRAITVRAQRARQHAADLDEMVRANAALTTIIEEYEEFDRAWHSLLDHARLAPEVDAHLRRVGRRVRQVDLQLHAALYVDVPLVNSRQQMVALSASIARTAAHLADDLEADARPADRDAVYEARLFTRVAQELSRAVADPQTAQVEQKAFRDLTGAWQRLHAHLETLPRQRFEHSLAIAAELGKDLQRLEAHFRAS